MKEKKVMTKKKLYPFITILIGALISCSNSADLVKSAIIEKWVQTEGKMEFEFFKDGTVIMVEGERSTRGTFKFINYNLIRVDLGVKGIKTYEVNIDKNGLSLEPKSKAYKFTTKKDKENLLARREKLLNESFIFDDLTAKDKNGYVWTRDGNLTKEMTWNEAGDFITRLNAEKYGGYNDWRLPESEELITLAKYGKILNDFFKEESLASSFNRIGFKNVQACGYWTSTSDEKNAGYIWTVSMWYGRVGNFSKNYEACVWPVRFER